MIYQLTTIALFSVFVSTYGTGKFVKESTQISNNLVDKNSTVNVDLKGSTCGGNCPSGTCGSCPCGNEASIQDIPTWCSKYSGWNQANCECIMLHESAANANAMHQNPDGHIDVGLWQINNFNWDACNNGNSPCDPAQNLNCAIDVYNWGNQTWTFWDTCSLCNACNSP